MKNKHKRRPKDVVSYNMSRIKSSGSKIEKLLGKEMHLKNLRYRKQYRIYGKPDFVFPSLKIAVFADSNFWHGHNWYKKGKDQIKTNRDFWIPKIEKNIKRDNEVNVLLKKEGWIVIRFWEDKIKNNPIKCAEVVKRTVIKRKNQLSMQ